MSFPRLSLCDNAGDTDHCSVSRIFPYPIIARLKAVHDSRQDFKDLKRILAMLEKFRLHESFAKILTQ